MGKGDHKTRRGKIFLGSYGKLRRRKESSPAFVSDNIKPEAEKAAEAKKAKATPKTEKKAAPKKAVAKKTSATKTETKKTETKKTETKKAPVAKKPATKKATKEVVVTDKKEESAKDEE